MAELLNGDGAANLCLLGFVLFLALLVWSGWWLRGASLSSAEGKTP